MSTATVASQTHALQCMEVWGGNRAIHSGISVPGIDAWISSDPYEGNARGGDIHYVSMCGAGKISRFAITDVSGHGDTVGELADRLRLLMRKYINTLNQTRLARALNQDFSRLAQTGRFATSLLTTYFSPTDHLIVCNAGHPRPLWYHAASKTWELLDHDLPQRATEVVNLPLGIIEPTDYVQFAVKLDQGDLVMIYTDSLMEAANAEGVQLGEQGLLDLVRSIDVERPQDLNAEVLAAVAAYRQAAAADDDQTLLLLHHTAADPPKQSIGEKMHVLAKMLGLASVEDHP